MSSWIIKDTTTFEMELCRCKQATAPAHLQSHCMWLNPEHTKNSNHQKKKSATTKIELESAHVQNKKWLWMKELSNCSFDICCLCCPTIEFCGISAGVHELEVDGLPANVGMRIVPLFCLSSLVKKRPRPCSLWNWSSFSLCCARVNSLMMISSWPSVSCHDFLSIFVRRLRQPRCSWALFISPISYMLRIWVSRRTTFITNFSCSRTCSLRDSIYPCCASCSSNLWAQACCWSSLMQLLKDPTWWSCLTSSDLAWLSKWSSLLSRRDLLKFDGSACLQKELLNWFPNSSLPKVS